MLENAGGWVDYAKSIDNTDKELLKFLTDVDDGKRDISDIDDYMKSAESATFSFGTALKSVAANIGIMLAINLAIKGIVWLIDEAITTTEEYREKLSSLSDECSQIESDLSSCNEQLKTTVERMRELEGKGTLTFTEKEEYDNLVKQNNELERTIALLEHEQEVKNKEKNEAFVNTMQSDTQTGEWDYYKNDQTGKIGKGNASLHSVIGGLSGSTATYSMATEQEYIKQQFEEREKLLQDKHEASTIEEKKRIQDQIDEIDSYLQSKSTQWETDSEGIDYISNPNTDDEKAVNEWLDFIADFQDRMLIATSQDDAKSNADAKTYAFNRIIDSSQFDDTVQGLQNLGKQGQVTAEMLNDPKYDEFIQKLVELGVIETADDLDFVALAFNNFADSTNVAGDALDDFANETGISIEELNKNINNAYDSISKSYDAVKEFKEAMSDGMTESALDSVAGLSDELKAMVAEFHAGTVSADELFEELTKHYENDLKNYSEAIIIKNQYNEEFYNTVGLNDTEFVNHMNKNYGVDIKNCKSYAEAKIAIEQQLLKGISGMWSKYYDIQSNTFTQEWTNLNNQIDNLEQYQGSEKGKHQSIAFGADPDKLTELKKIKNSVLSNKSYVDLYNKAVEELNNTTYKGIESSFNDKSDNFDKKSKESTTYFDHIETRLDNLNDALDETKEKANDTLNGWSDRSDAYNQSLAQILTLKAEQEKARAKYLEEANKSGLSNNYKRLVEQGAIQIDKLSNDDPLKEQIESYQKWYEKVKECDEAIEQLDKDYLKWTNDSREFRWESFDYLEDSISRITDEANDLIDLLSNKDLFDNKGNLNEYGNATLALHVSNLEVYKQQAKDYYEQMQDLRKELANGGGEDALNKLNEISDKHVEMIKNVEQEKQSILDLISDGYDKQYKSLQKIIDKKKESLNIEKD